MTKTNVLNVLPVTVPTWAKFHLAEFKNGAKYDHFKNRDGATLNEDEWWYCEIHAWAQVVYTYEPDVNMNGVTVADGCEIFDGLFGYYAETIDEGSAQDTHGSMELANEHRGFVEYTTIKPKYMDSRDVPKEESNENS